MPTIRLTQLAVERLAAPMTGREIHWDRHLPGFGVRITAKGAKSWVAMYRVNGKTVMETLGPVPRLPKVDDARAMARGSMERAAAGVHPVFEKRLAAKRVTMNTVNAAVEKYLGEGGRASAKGSWKPKTAREWRRIFEHDVLPRWGERPIAEIGKSDVLELLNDKAATRERKRKGLTGGAAVQAGKTLTRLRTFFGWCVANDLMEGNPTAGVRRPAKEATRDRVLTDAEIKLFWIATGSLGNPFGPLFRLLLVTAQRESEVAGIRWSEIDFNARQWTIPGERAKNGKPHIVHVSNLAVEIITSLPHIAGQDLLFSRTGTSAPSGFSRGKARLDAAMLNSLKKDHEDAELAPWVLHDLRRTGTTGMARLGIAPHVADRVLNHVAGTIRGVAAVYNRFEYLDERRGALDTWGRYITSLVGNRPQNVVLLGGRGPIV